MIGQTESIKLNAELLFEPLAVTSEGSEAQGMTMES